MNATTCLTNADASNITSRWATILGSGAAVNSTAVSDFVDPSYQGISDSINFVEEIPVRNATSLVILHISVIRT
jgi:hypothetical protein